MSAEPVGPATGVPPGDWTADYLKPGLTWKDLSRRQRHLVSAIEMRHAQVRRAKGAADRAERTRRQATLTDDSPQQQSVSYKLATPGGCFVSRYVLYACERTDAPAAAHEMAAFAILSALAGPGPRIPLATAPRGMSLVEWLMYIVNSTVGRKTTVLEIARDVIVVILGEEAVLNWEGSPQGLIQRLQERDGKTAVFLRDEYSGLIQQINRGGHMAGLDQTFIRAHDGNVLENVRTRKRNKATGEKELDTDRVERPYLVKLTAATWTSFMERANRDNVLDGFLARFVFLTGEGQPRPVRLTSDWMVREREALIAEARAFFARTREVEIVQPTQEVLDAWWELQQAWDEKARSHSQPEAARPALQRLSESVLRAAGLLALDRDKEPESIATTDDLSGRRRVWIMPEDFGPAAEIGERWLKGTLAVIEGLGATRFQRDCDRVAAFVARYPNGVAYRAISRANRGVRTRDLEDVLKALDQQGRIWFATKEPGEKGGRPTYTVHPGTRPGEAAE